MSIPTGNGATGASGTGPALGYTLNLLWFNILFMLISENNLNTSTYFVHTLSLFYVMNLLVIFRIKIYRKLTISLTEREKKKEKETKFNLSCEIQPFPLAGTLPQVGQVGGEQKQSAKPRDRDTSERLCRA